MMRIGVDRFEVGISELNCRTVIGMTAAVAGLGDTGLGSLQ